MKKKTIFFAVTNDLVYDQRMIRICTTLSKAGYIVKLIGRKRSFSRPLDEKVFEQKRFNCFFEKGKLFYIEYNIRLFCYLLFSKYDAVCCIDLDTLTAGYFAAIIKRKVCIYDAHEYFTEVPEVIDRPLVKKVWEAVAQYIIPQIKHCYTVCESLASVFFERYGVEFEVIRNVPFRNRDELSSSAPKTPKIILYQGALNAGRGLEQSVEAMQHVKGAELWLVGEGDLSANLRDLVKMKKLEKKVIFKGYVKPKELPKITAKASIGLNLLENKSLNYYYSLANKAFDYIQAEIPAIHMDFPEYRQLNQTYEVACLIDHLDPVLIGNSITKLLENKALYSQLVQNCKAAKEVLIWELEEQKLLDFYKKLFNNKSPH